MRKVHFACLVLVLALATILRFTGITWGVPSPEYPHYPFHPDEAWAMAKLCDVNPAADDWLLDSAYREGSLPAYLFLGNALLLKEVGWISGLPCKYAQDSPVLGTSDYRRVLLSSRALVAIMDVFSVLLIFLILRRITGPWSALAAAGIYAIIPFQLVYAHYMRNHTPANLTILLVIYASLGLAKHASRKRILLAGILSGIAISTRYTSIVVLAVPVLMIASELFRKRDSENKLWRLYSVLEGGAILGISAVIGLLLSSPHLLLASDTVSKQIGVLGRYTAKDEFSLSKLLDLERMWAYLTYLIPNATGLSLWIVLAACTVYTLFLRKYHVFTLPWIAMNLAYLYFMAKGYAAPVYARAALALFPVFALLTGIALHDLFSRLRRSPTMRWIPAVSLALVAGWTLLVDAAYLRAMTGERDTRYQVRRHLLDQDLELPLEIGLYEDNRIAYFTTQPAFVLEDPDSANFQSRTEFSEAAPEVDLVALSGYNRNHRRTEGRRQQLLESGWYEPQFTALPEYAFFGMRHDYRSLPPDMQYPFVELYLLKPAPAAIRGAPESTEVGREPGEPNQGD